MRSGCLSARIVNGCIWAPAGNAEATWKQEHFARTTTVLWENGCGDRPFPLSPAESAQKIYHSPAGFICLGKHRHLCLPQDILACIGNRFLRHICIPQLRF